MQDLHTKQKCFEFQSPGRVAKIAMVSGDADEDWEFEREFRSMADCEAHANHG